MMPIARAGAVGFAGGGHQHRQAGTHQHRQRLGRERHAQLAAPAVRGHEDEVAAARARRLDDGLRRLVADDMARFAGHAQRARRGFGLGQQLARLAEIGVFVLVACGQAQHLGVAAQRAGGIGDGMEEGDAGAERACQRDGVADHLDRKVGVVDGNEQMAVHGELLRLPRRYAAKRRTVLRWIKATGHRSPHVILRPATKAGDG